MDADRLDWIFDGSDDETLGERYDSWAATYDSDHGEWGWRGPDLVAAAAVRNVGDGDAVAPIIDAGCGTGMVGVALRSAGWKGELIGLDLSQGMLDEASKSGAYDQLIRCSLYDVPLVDGVGIATVSAGVFTLGHVGGEAFAELCRTTRSGGVVTLTQRLDFADRFAPHIDALSATGDWVEIERSEHERLHPGRDDNEQTVVSWRVR